MKRLVLAVAILLCASLAWGRMGPVACGGGQGIAASCTSSNDSAVEVVTSTLGSSRAVDGSSWRAQSFTNANAFSITCVKTYVADTGSDVGSFLVKIYTDSGSNLPGSVISGAETSKPASEIAATATEYEICFSSPVTGLSASTKYWVVVGASGGGTFSFYRLGTSAYANGGESTSGDGGVNWGAESAVNDYTMTIMGCEP